jgi:hypothetical protein
LREFRCIVFSNQELLSALIDFRRKSRLPLPVGTVSNISFSTEGNAVVTRVTLLDDYNAATEMRIEATEVAAAAVNYCLERKTPMAKSYHKKIEIMDGQITLVMTMSVDTTKPSKHPMPKRSDGRNK